MADQEPKEPAKESGNGNDNIDKKIIKEDQRSFEEKKVQIEEIRKALEPKKNR